MIQIIKVTPNLFIPEAPLTRTATFIIQRNGGTIYWYAVGDLPGTGNVQTILNGREEELYVQAVANGVLATSAEVALAESRTWYIAHPNAAAVFNQSVSELDTAIHDLVFAMFPNATTVQKQSMYLLLMDVALVSRIYAFNEKLLGNGS